MTSWAMQHQGRLSGADPLRSETILGTKTPLDRHNQQLVLQNNHKTYGLMRACLEEDLRALSDAKSTEKKAELKRVMLPKYADYVRAYCNVTADNPAASHANDVLVQNMIWRFDVGDISEALDLAYVCIRDRQHMPERFARRDIATFAADALFDWASAQVKSKHSPSPYFDRVLVDIETGAWDVIDEIRAKYQRLAGEIAHDSGQLKKAETHLIAAANFGAQVKTRLAKVQADLAKAPPVE